MAYDDEDFDDEIQGERPPLDPNIRKQLREAEKAKKELESLRSELDAQKREVQFSKAGIPDSGLGQLFRKAYDGDTSLDAIRQSAEEYGILQTPASIPEPSNDSELEALRRVQGATIGTTGAAPDSQQLYLEQLAAASTPEEVMRVVSGDTGQKVGVWTSRGSQ